MAEEFRRVNDHIRSWLRSPPRFVATIEIQPDAFKNYVYRQIFNGNGDPPTSLTQSEASKRIRVGNTITTRGVARTKELEILETLVEAVSEESPIPGQMRDQREAAVRFWDWLNQTEPLSDCADAPLSTPPRNNDAPSPMMDASSDAGGVPVGNHSQSIHGHRYKHSSNSSTQWLSGNAANQLAQNSIRLQNEGKELRKDPNEPRTPHQAGNSEAHKVNGSQPENLFAPRPQNMFTPSFINMPTSDPTPPHTFPATAANSNQHYYPYPAMSSAVNIPPNMPFGQVHGLYHPHQFQLNSAQGPPMYGMPPQQVFPQQPTSMLYGNYGPLYGHALPQTPFAMPPYGFIHGYPVSHTPLTVMGQQQFPIPPRFPSRPGVGVPPPMPPQTPTPNRVRATLPPAERLATVSTWAKPKEFNVAEWAQEHRPKTPGSSNATVVPPPNPLTVSISNAASAMHVMRYRVGMDTMYPKPTGEMSTRLRELTKNGDPTFAQATDPDFFPFEGISRYGGPPPWGVVRIGNIPYDLTRQEVVAFLGRHARILPASLGCSVHIILDRLAGKTMDCFVEFHSVADAQALVTAKNRPGQVNKLGDRVPVVSISSQDLLLEAMFPKARNVQWQNGMPVVTASTDPFNTGFKGLVTHEEMVKLVQHAEFPQRSNYTTKCQQRVYECMISTVSKFPWYAVDAYTIGTRNQIFAACNDLLRILLTNVKKGSHSQLSGALIEELLYAALNAQGFSDKQRWILCQTAELNGRAVRISPIAKDWPFEVLVRKPNVPEDVVSWYVDRLTRHLERRGVRPTMNPFRTFLLPPSKGEEETARGQGDVELGGVVEVFRVVLEA